MGIIHKSYSDVNFDRWAKGVCFSDICLYCMLITSSMHGPTPEHLWEDVLAKDSKFQRNVVTSHSPWVRGHRGILGDQQIRGDPGWKSSRHDTQPYVI